MSEEPKNSRYYAKIKEDAMKMREVRAHRRDYLKKNYRAFVLRFNAEKDKEIIDWLDERDSYTPYVRNLIKADIYRRSKKEDGNAKIKDY